ncbi:MAG: DUF4381 family protein, partial [Sedimentisphaerales bacterium]|nr:DUF4381 family protein [Sedimentisphaerales bacterium]
RRGPARLLVQVDRQEITIAERLTLVLAAEIDEDFEIEMPRFGEKLEQFGIVDYRNPPARLTEKGKLLYRRSYVLEPFLSGNYTIPAMKILFRKKGDPDQKTYELETEEIPIQVKSLLAETVADLEIREIAGPVSLPPPRRGWIYGLLAGSAALVLAGIILWRRRRRRVAALATSRIPAHELAYRELEGLLAEHLVEQGRVKLFYYRLSDILRGYLENRFGLHAPERTTEEFLAELGSGETLHGDHQQLLAEYLQHCDLVKFAERQPTTQDIQRTFDACKRFIGETESAAALTAEPCAA